MRAPTRAATTGAWPSIAARTGPCRCAGTCAREGQRAGGLSDLARRCPYAWLVLAPSDDDRVALTLAAVLATVLLGPIVTPSGRRIFGVRGARMALEAAPPGYR